MGLSLRDDHQKRRAQRKKNAVAASIKPPPSLPEWLHGQLDGNAGLVPGLPVLGETEKLQEGRRFSAVASTLPEPGMNPREGDLLEVVYWQALVISWHQRLSLLDTEPDPKGLTCQQSLDRQNQSVWGSK